MRSYFWIYNACKFLSMGIFGFLAYKFINKLSTNIEIAWEHKDINYAFPLLESSGKCTVSLQSSAENMDSRTVVCNITLYVVYEQAALLFSFFYFLGIFLGIGHLGWFFCIVVSTRTRRYFIIVSHKRNTNEN